MSICDGINEKEPKYIKFTTANVDPILPSPGSSPLRDTGAVITAQVKSYLIGNYSYYTDMTEFNKELIPAFSLSMHSLADSYYAREQQILIRLGDKKITRNRELTQTYGTESSTASNYTPKKDGEQQQELLSGTNINWQPDNTTETFEEFASNDNLALSDLYRELPNMVAEFFGKYINTIMF